jgi:hypothetical protein
MPVFFASSSTSGSGGSGEMPVHSVTASIPYYTLPFDSAEVGSYVSFIASENHITVTGVSTGTSIPFFCKELASSIEQDIMVVDTSATSPYQTFFVMPNEDVSISSW